MFHPRDVVEILVTITCYETCINLFSFSSYSSETILVTQR